MFGSSKKDHERAYGKGVRDAQNASAWDHFTHGIEDLGSSVIPHPKSSTSKSYEAGYHSGKGRRRGRSRSTYSGSSSSSETGWFAPAIGLIFIALLIIGALTHPGKKTTRTRDENFTAGTRTTSKINANKLNLRSGPGTNHPVLMSFKRGDKVIFTGETQIIDGEEWAKIIVRNGRIEGWSLRKFIKP